MRPGGTVELCSLWIIFTRPTEPSDAPNARRACAVVVHKFQFQCGLDILMLTCARRNQCPGRYCKLSEPFLRDLQTLDMKKGRGRIYFVKIESVTCLSEVVIWDGWQLRSIYLNKDNVPARFPVTRSEASRNGAGAIPKSG
jgi:hypothetical protein